MSKSYELCAVSNLFAQMFHACLRNPLELQILLFFDVGRRFLKIAISVFSRTSQAGPTARPETDARQPSANEPNKNARKARGRPTKRLGSAEREIFRKRTGRAAAHSPVETATPTPATPNPRTQPQTREPKPKPKPENNGARTPHFPEGRKATRLRLLGETHYK